MKHKKTVRIFVFVILVAVLAAGVAMADDGLMFRRNISKTPEQVTERANLGHMTFYVPAQSSEGELTPVEYYKADATLHETRDYAKPLVAVYIDALEEHEEEDVLARELQEAGIYSGTSFGAHDAHAALSLDDGTTWKRSNLSLSADLTSFTLATGDAYPGDAHNMTMAIAGDKVLVGWISKYCDGGSPNYTIPDEDIDALQIAYELPDLYVNDIWGVAGAQSSVDYTALGFPEVGEIPYSCVWSARGTLLEDLDTGLFDIVWTKAERLTSGRRDANRLEMNADGAAGFMMTWQEDPEGLRPGQGLGPGEGWSGAVVNQQTDLWYSYISVADFEMVQTSDDVVDPVSIYEYDGETMPKAAVPMAMPVRLTDNKMCKTTGSDPYCYIDFDDVDPYGATILPDDLPTTKDTNSTFCAEEELWTTPAGTTTLSLCKAEDGRVLGGRVGASRPRVNVQPYDADDDDVYENAWVIMGAEESKALGEGAADPDDEEVEIEDLGKNMWYYSFDLLNPAFVKQGGMLNQPAIDRETGTFFELLEDDFGNPFYETEISRRFSHFSQPIHQIGEAGVSAVLIVKQGILNQGGPADIFLRRLVVPDDIWEECEIDGDESTVDRCLPAGYNPYAYGNMACDDWVYPEGENPRYIEGLCLSNMINVSGGTIVSCDGVAGDCADQFPWDGKDDIGDDGFPKVTEWVQTVDNLDDQSWENPYDVSKGHRGFIDGDFIMMMYAWSPNWQANSVGNDHYNLYARRSFDGGLTWTTTPAELGGVGTETCENYKNGSEINTVCTTYGVGEFEQSRNLSQLIGNKVTILDPRYSPSGGIKMLPITDLKENGFEGYEDDERDPSKFFIVYETGDNTTVATGEAVPMDLFYSRATAWGDEYDLVEYTDTAGDITEGFDWLEHDREDLSGEAANTANNGGNFYYVIWNQWKEDEHENVSDSDAIFRRIMYLDDAEDEVTAPITEILYVSQKWITLDEIEEGDPLILTLVGTARDGDHAGELPHEDIGGYQWYLDGEPVDDGDDDPKRLNWGINGLSDFNGMHPGWHNFSFKACDKGGNWSPGATVEVFVTNHTSRLYFPVTLPDAAE